MTRKCDVISSLDGLYSHLKGTDETPPGALVLTADFKTNEPVWTDPATDRRITNTAVKRALAKDALVPRTKNPLTDEVDSYGLSPEYVHKPRQPKKRRA